MAAFQGIEQTRKKFDFPPEVLDIIISGRSSIDSPSGFQISSLEDAEKFVRSYGFNLENPIEKAEATGNFHEAINFIRRYFLAPENPEGLKLEVPRKILELKDVRELFLLASMSFPDQRSDTQGNLLRNWACALLKVMHTIAHIDQDIRTSYFTEIQKQIFDRYYRLIHRDLEEKLFLGEKTDDPFRINLVAFETKPKKSRDSTLLKLLHKPENVAEDIFDRVGIRFVTQSRMDAIRVIKFLKDKMLVMPPNIKPSRSRNTLVDLEALRTRIGELMPKLECGEIDEFALESKLEEAVGNVLVGKGNIHSSEYYRAIQFTARQLIKLRNPIYGDIRELKSQARSTSLPEEVLKLVERIDLKYLQKEVRFFYPYEVQVVDHTSFVENEKGRSAHSEYKRAQVQTAMKRVMGALAESTK